MTLVRFAKLFHLAVMIFGDTAAVHAFGWWHGLGLAAAGWLFIPQRDLLHLA